jgi:D-xylonolactonase
MAAELGEGPAWSASEGALWLVDIKGRQIHRFDPKSALKWSWPAPDQVSFVLPETGSCLIVGLPGRIARFDPAAGTFESLMELDAEPAGNRLNDACVDAAGRLWFGTMDDSTVAASGALYSWDGAAAPIKHDDGYVITNGPIHSPDGRTFFHTDSVGRTIYKFDIADDGSLSNKRPFVEIESGCGLPDGSTVDAEGCLWVALYGGWAVRRYAPNGELLETVAVPCANVTKLVFGGDDLKTAFVTTAWMGLNADERRAQPLAGSLFAFNVDVPGLTHHSVTTAK